MAVPHAGLFLLSLLLRPAHSYLTTIFGLHRISEGHIGVYYRGGRLLPTTNEPGYRWVPFAWKEEVQVTVQTDKVTNIPCGTSGGTMISFGKIEVVNRLRRDFVHATVKNYTVNYDKTWIYDKIHHEINQFCSQHTLHEVYIEKFNDLDDHLKKALQRDCDLWAPGIQIISIRVTKPSVPPSLLSEYEQMESEKAQLKIEKERQLRVAVMAETEQKKAVIEAQKEAEVAAIDAQRQADVKRIEMDMRLQEQEMASKVATVRNDQVLNEQKKLADGELYAAQQRAAANELLLTPQYLQLEMMRSVANNTKIYFGERIPKMFISPDAQSLGSKATLTSVNDQAT